MRCIDWDATRTDFLNDYARGGEKKAVSDFRFCYPAKK